MNKAEFFEKLNNRQIPTEIMEMVTAVAFNYAHDTSEKNLDDLLEIIGLMETFLGNDLSAIRRELFDFNRDLRKDFPKNSA